MSDEKSTAELALKLATKNAEAINQLTIASTKTAGTLSMVVEGVDKLENTMGDFIKRTSANESWRAQWPLIAIMISVAGLLITVGGLVLSPLLSDIRDINELNKAQSVVNSQMSSTMAAMNTKLTLHDSTLLMLDQHSRNGKEATENVARLVEQMNVAQADILSLQERINLNGWSKEDHDRYERTKATMVQLIHDDFQRQIDQLWKEVHDGK